MTVFKYEKCSNLMIMKKSKTSFDFLMLHRKLHFIYIQSEPLVNYYFNLPYLQRRF